MDCSASGRSQRKGSDPALATVGGSSSSCSSSAPPHGVVSYAPGGVMRHSLSAGACGAAGSPVHSPQVAEKSSRSCFSRTFGSGDGVGIFSDSPPMEQSPAAASSKAHSEPPSEFSSWHDDGSSYATCSNPDMRVTVNTQRFRMGEHLKGKLAGMIRQRFENYMTIIHTFQNDIGKLTALECQLRAPFGLPMSSRISITCNEDGTFLVYVMPDTIEAVEGDGEDDADRDNGSAAVAPDPPPSPAQDAAATDPAGSVAAHEELLKGWQDQLCAFGMSGRCHSLTALLHCGYNEWKKILGSLWKASGGQDRGQIAEEEERPPWEEARYASELSSTQQVVPTAAASHTIGTSSSSSSPSVVAATASAAPLAPGPTAPGAVGGAMDGWCAASAPAAAAVVPPTEAHATAVMCAMVASATAVGTTAAPPVLAKGSPRRPSVISHVDGLLLDAKEAIENSRHTQALEMCVEGVAMARSLLDYQGNDLTSSAASASSSAPPAALVEKAFMMLGQFLALRAGVQARLGEYELALHDAEEVISLLPTCAEGYYLRSVALQGLGHAPEALEALMSALAYEPQNPLYQQAFNSLFEEMSTRTAEISPGGNASTRPPRRGGSREEREGTSVLHRRPRGPGDALSTTTMATHLSSRSTTPTEVSEPLSRSSSMDSPMLSNADR